MSKYFTLGNFFNNMSISGTPNASTISHDRRPSGSKIPERRGSHRLDSIEFAENSNQPKGRSSNIVNSTSDSPNKSQNNGPLVHGESWSGLVSVSPTADKTQFHSESIEEETNQETHNVPARLKRSSTDASENSHSSRISDNKDSRNILQVEI